MKQDNFNIRKAREEDARALLAIYAPYVEQTAITFEYTVPTVAEFERRIAKTLQKYPYLVAELDGKIAGYTYGSVFHQRRAYEWSVETSIYVDRSLRKRGIGGNLYQALEEVLGQMGIQNLNACIACPRQPDEYLDNGSIEFHRHQGYRLVGRFYQCGSKFGRWYDMVWMEKHIGPHQEPPEPVTWYPCLKGSNRQEQ